MPKLTIDLLRDGDVAAQKIFHASFQPGPGKLEYFLDWTPFQINELTVGLVRGNFDASNRFLALVLQADEKQVFDSVGNLAEHKGIQFGVRFFSDYIGLFFEPDDVVY
jgi:hypothetical protein